jgi:hypothetical protein
MKRTESMQADAIELVPFAPHHLEGAMALSRQAGWPHHLKDWAPVLSPRSGGDTGPTRQHRTVTLARFSAEEVRRIELPQPKDAIPALLTF